MTRSTINDTRVFIFVNEMTGGGGREMSRARSRNKDDIIGLGPGNRMTAF